MLKGETEQILVPCDPLAGNEFLEQRPVEAARGLVVDVLDDSGLAQASGLEATFEALARDRSSWRDVPRRGAWRHRAGGAGLRAPLPCR